MGTEVFRPHDCLARARRPRPLRPGPAGRRAAAAARGGDARGPSASAAAATATAPRQVRTKVAEAYAGPAFGAMSPSPRALPLPRFPARTAADAAPGVDDAATRELRRLLGLH
ncbi:translation initiation factor IF-2-like [Panicum virgatum]|uniref:Uncharacterized protein n=1 Tax=Panicum virgatum TaxID=38727 RepID=A0A8T0UZG5_PANVG|nr:translation initiation factor IF-2-like [Panicum virgatum]KAG2627637.1 hypothetical protein PVAP13_3KG261927 [Panicum virgatum]KAG2627638.1 hypothetical protein PVAP13_3KG261927 [Panicum virgatum]